jgi:hypothetical protein
MQKTCFRFEFALGDRREHTLNLVADRRKTMYIPWPFFDLVDVVCIRGHWTLENTLLGLVQSYTSVNCSCTYSGRLRLYLMMLLKISAILLANLAGCLSTISKR